MLRAVLFDLDGVLIDSRYVWYALQRTFARENGYPDLPHDPFMAVFGQGTDQDREMWFPRHSVEELDRYFCDHFCDHLEHMRAEPAASGLLATLRARGMGTAVVTNTTAPLARHLCERLDLGADQVCGTGEGPRPKPTPDLVHHAMGLLGVGPGESWMVGDSSYDRDAAVAAGVRFVGLGIDGDLRIERLGELLDHLP